MAVVDDNHANSYVTISLNSSLVYAVSYYLVLYMAPK